MIRLEVAPMNLAAALNADYARAVERLTWRRLARRAPDSERLHAARRVS
jgi:hypothetical protein